MRNNKKLRKRNYQRDFPAFDEISVKTEKNEEAKRPDANLGPKLVTG